MEQRLVEILVNLASQTEFWSAIVGAIVGGLIAYIVQVKALREGRKQRNEDHRRVQQAQGHELLFKMIRIHSGFSGIHQHIESCFEQAARKGLTGEPWQFVLPLANPPDPVHFSSEEMGMLLALKNDDVFNSVVSMDVIHNSLSTAVALLTKERRELTERLRAEEAKGAVLSGVLDPDQALVLRPRMIEVNSLIESIRAESKRDFEESGEVLGSLNKLFRDKLELTYRLEPKVKAPLPNSPQDDVKLSAKQRRQRALSEAAKKMER
jgi:hypothetical protein